METENKSMVDEYDCFDDELCEIFKHLIGSKPRKQIADFNELIIKQLLEDDEIIYPPENEEVPEPIPDYSGYNSFLYYHVMRCSSTLIKSQEPELSMETIDAVCDIIRSLSVDETYNYPKKPYYRHISHMIRLWIQTKSQPIVFKKMDGLQEVEDDTIRLSEFTNELLQIYERWNTSDKTYLLELILQKLKVQGIMTLLGVRKTKGSVHVLPPSIKQLIATFNIKHTEKTPGVYLTVGARALSKHYFRSRDGFWGDNKGSDLTKNKEAEKILAKIMSDVWWMNIHLLPHNIVIFECRNKEGYGARWAANGFFEFRGFLEPQIIGGHEVGWIH